MPPVGTDLFLADGRWDFDIDTDIFLTAFVCKPDGSGKRIQTEITYINKNQYQQYKEQTNYTTLGGIHSADCAPSLRLII